MISTCFDSNRSVLRVSFFKVKQRSDFVYDYMSFAIMGGNNPRTPS